MLLRSGFHHFDSIVSLLMPLPDALHLSCARARASFSFHKADDDDDDDDDRPSLRFSMRTNSMAEGGRGRPESI